MNGSKLQPCFSRITAAAVAATLAGAARAEVDFGRDIAPVLESKCLGCHTANIAKGDVDLSTAAAAAEHLKPGDADASDGSGSADTDAPRRRCRKRRSR